MASGKQRQSETDVCRNEVERRSQGKVNRNRAPNEDGPDRDVFFVPPGRKSWIPDIFAHGAGRLRAESASQCGSAFADGQVDAFFRVKPLDNMV
jgi:hypothetical protein